MRVKLIKKVPKEILEIMEVVGNLADEYNIPAYIVGGIVRDIFLGKLNYDVDFVVEGDGIGFARMVNKYIKGLLTTHQAFKTATIEYDDTRIDIVTARREHYEKPAAYPKVMAGAIKDDLFRRDFTINAMAIGINKDNFGELVDFYSGFKDLKKGIVRVMHDKSFIDDPTRIFRAIRFSVRFGFKIEAATLGWMKEAARLGLIGELNKGRIKKEMELFMEEENPAECLKRFSEVV